MKLSELIKELESQKKLYGDLEVFVQDAVVLSKPSPSLHERHHLDGKVDKYIVLNP